MLQFTSDRFALRAQGGEMLLVRNVGLARSLGDCRVGVGLCRGPDRSSGRHRLGLKSCRLRRCIGDDALGNRC